MSNKPLDVDRMRSTAKKLRAALRAVDERVGSDARKFLNSLDGDSLGAQSVMIDGATWRQMREALELSKDLT